MFFPLFYIFSWSREGCYVREDKQRNEIRDRMERGEKKENRQYELKKRHFSKAIRPFFLAAQRMRT